MTIKNEANGDAIDVLRGEQRSIQSLFSRYRKFKPGALASAGKMKLLQKICAALSVHIRTQQELLLPALREAENAEPLPDGAVVRNAAILRLAEELQHVKSDDELVDAKMKVLAEYVQSDIDQSESELFPRTRQAGVDLRALGDQISVRKAELASIKPTAALASGVRRASGNEPVPARS